MLWTQFLDGGWDFVLNASPLIVAIATVVVGWTAFEAHRRESNRIRERTHEADARISAISYALRRQIRSWGNLTGWPNDWRLSKKRASEMVRHFPAAEERSEDLLALVPEASAEVADWVRQAVVRFYRAAGYVNEMDRTELVPAEDHGGDPTKGEPPVDVLARFLQARLLLIDAEKGLDKAIGAKLKEAEGNAPR